MRKREFGKALLIADYAILVLMVAAFVAMKVKAIDTTECSVVICAWIAQIAISSGCYYWKAKAENLVKLPILLLRDLPPDMREKADPNQIIASVLGIGTQN